MSGAIRFDSAAYERLLNVIGAVVGNLGQNSGGDSQPLSSLQVQPDGQTWQPAVDLVTVGRQLLGSAGTSDDALVGAVGTIHQGLVHARSVFQDVDDLTTLTASQFWPYASDGSSDGVQPLGPVISKKSYVASHPGEQ